MLLRLRFHVGMNIKTQVNQAGIALTTWLQELISSKRSIFAYSTAGECKFKY